MGLSGAAGGAAQSLEQILTQQMLQAQAAQRQKLAEAELEHRRVEERNRMTEVASRQKFQQGQTDRDDAETALKMATPGEITPALAETLRKSPGIAPSVTNRRVIEGVRPVVPGMSGMDESGPQQFSVLEPTQAQAEGQHKKTRIKEISKILGGATNESQRRAVGAEALGEGLDIPNNLLGQTSAEKTAQELAEDARTNREWDRRNAISNRQAGDRRGSMTPKQELDETKSLRTQYQKETASARTIQQQYQLMQSGMEAARAGNMNAGSQSVLVTFQKILDPESVVRESEYARSPEGLSMLSRVQGAYERFQKGGVGMPLSDLEQFESVARTFMENSIKNSERSKSQINAIADRWGLDKSLITEDTVAPPEPTKQPPVDTKTNSKKQTRYGMDGKVLP